LLRYGEPGAERPGLLDTEGVIRDLGDHVADIAGSVLSDQGLAKLRALDPKRLPRVEGGPRIGACVGAIGKFVCVGLNYADHAAETGNMIPEEPVLFMKATSAVCGPNDAVEIPRGSGKTDWEVELGVVIGRRTKHVRPIEALDAVAGYCVVNDVSERAFQSERGGQWTKGKSADTFGPLGPWLVTRDEIPDPQALSLWLDVDGERRQTGTTARMIFDVAQLVSYISGFMTLHPGDVIATGTPPGVGLGHRPPVYLRPGQTMRLGIDGLGEQRQTVIQGA
jgi:2-keto-4-pentenoate hydratase/2-oxohepta-3-ene-1,7-dioic acid hydratase in catechol pathway